MRAPLVLGLLLTLCPVVAAQDQDPEFDEWPQADPLSPDQETPPPLPPPRDDPFTPRPPPYEPAPAATPEPLRAAERPFLNGRVELAYRGWYVSNIQTRVGREKGNDVYRVQTDDDLGIDDNLAHILDLRVKLFKWLEVRVEYLYVELDGAIDLSGSDVVDYNGETFANEDIHSRMTTQGLTIEANLGWEWSHIKIGGLVGARYLTTRVGIRSEDDGDHTSERDSFWSSVLGIEARFRAGGEPDVGGYVRLRGNAGYWDNEATAYFDFESGFTITFLEHLRVTLGYRYLFGYLHRHGKRDRLSQFEYAGPWAGLALRF